MGEAPAPSILIIDDTPENLRVVVRLFEAYHFEILTARDGEAGLARARLARPAVILLDVQMPGIDGYETCRRLKADPVTAPIPVLFMTVLSDPRDKVRAFEVGAVDYVTKPIEAAELLARVRAHLQIHTLQSELTRHAQELEDRVAERTAELARELAHSAAFQREREQLFELVRVQAEQLRRLTSSWLEERRSRDAGLSQALHEKVEQRLHLAQLHVSQALRLLPGPPNTGELAAVREHLGLAAELLGPAVEGTQVVGVDLGRAPDADPSDNPLLQLSTREYEVLQLMASGKSNKEIAYTLDVARTTVSTYRTRIMEKLGVQDMASLLKLAILHDVEP